MTTPLALLSLLVFGVAQLTPASASGARPRHVLAYKATFEARLGQLAARAELADRARAPSQPVLDNFIVVGREDLGLTDSNGDVWVHRDFAYVGTWSDPCNGRGVKIVDISDPANPTMIGRVAGIPGTSAEDVVVRSVSTPAFTGDLLATGIQRCDFGDSALDNDMFGVDLWDVTDPADPQHITHFGIATGGGGTHELDLFEQGQNVYVLAANPFLEWFDPEPRPDFQILDVTDPAAPAAVGAWGAAEEGLSPGPWSGQGEFNANLAHSARASGDGTRAYVSYWDLGVVTLDITDITNPTMLSHTQYQPTDEGNAHSVVPYTVGGRSFLLQNDEDGDPKGMAAVRDASGDVGPAVESIFSPPLFRETDHDVRGRVVRPRHQGCESSDYDGLRVRDAIALPKTFLTFFDPPPVKEQACRERRQDRVAARLGATAVVHDVIAENTRPSWFDVTDVRIPVLYTDHSTARAMVSSGRATITAGEPSWGFLRVYDAATGQQVASFDDLPYVHTLNRDGEWLVHNTEVDGARAYSSWYSHGIVALDLGPLAGTTPGDPTMVGQFVPKAAPSRTFFGRIPVVWGVYVRSSDGLVFASDINGGLWIVRPTGPAAS